MVAAVAELWVAFLIFGVVIPTGWAAHFSGLPPCPSVSVSLFGISFLPVRTRTSGSGLRLRSGLCVCVPPARFLISVAEEGSNSKTLIVGSSGAGRDPAAAPAAHTEPRSPVVPGSAVSAGYGVRKGQLYLYLY